MNQTDRRKYLIKVLLSEQQRYKGVEISENVLEQKTLLRSLMNVRMAAPISAEFEKIQDGYLQEVNAEKGHVALVDMDEVAPKSVYSDIFDVVEDKNYFVITTNVDHCFQKAGFDKKRLFYTQGDYGLFQCSEPCHEKTYDNEQMIMDMLKNQGYVVKAGELIIPEGRVLRTEIGSTYIPRCPKCGKPMSMNLRSDSTFVQDKGWEKAAEKYSEFLKKNKNKKGLFIELGVGYNTPGIIKYPFWQYTYNWEDASYVCINKGQADAPSEIKLKSICIDDDIAVVITKLREVME